MCERSLAAIKKDVPINVTPPTFFVVVIDVIMGKKHFIQGAVKKPGAETARAKRNGNSLGKQINKDLHSHNAKTRHRADFAKAMRSIARRHKH